MNPVHRNLPLLLLRAREAAMARFRPLLKEAGLTDQQWRVLRALSEAPGGLEPREIAALCVILSPSLTGILYRMVEQKLVTRAWSATDQRRQRIAIAPKGRALVDRLSPRVDAEYRRLELSFGAAALERAYDTLDGLLRALEARPAHSASTMRDAPSRRPPPRKVA
jgi:homoprotocatechuate degradation regulator HpaR